MMFMLALILVFSAFIALTILAASLLLALKSKPMTEKLSPFECGFSPKSNSRSIFSLQFFLVTIIFLIFDVELVLMFPFIPHLHNIGVKSLLVFLSFVATLSVGFIWEWNQAMLEWKK